MAFTGLTPESLIPRSDSRNPATTCKGITKAGKPCRRAIDAKTSRDDGVIVVASVISDSDEEEEEEEEETGLAAYFCWQHKDQAEELAARVNGPETQLYPLKERNSIDTLVERLGVLEIDTQSEEVPQRQRRTNRQEGSTPGARPPRRMRRPPTWENIEGPLMSIPSDVMAERRRRDQRPLKPPSPKKKPSFWTSLCCGFADDDPVEVVRHRKRTNQQPVTTQPEPEAAMQEMLQTPARIDARHNRRTRDTASRRTSSTWPQNTPSGRKPLVEKPARPVNKIAREDSETTQLLRYIPPTISPQLTSTLLTELSKPISPHDDEGYIYIFWLTPESAGPAPSSTASTLLSPPARPGQSRQTSDILRQFSVKQAQRTRLDASRRRLSNVTEDTPKDTILLKIGRASNVHRRMNEWTRQCGYSLSLVRYYPYVPSTPSPTPSPHPSPANSRRQSYQNRPVDARRRVSEGVRKVPHAHRVERLIHLELGQQRVVRKCEACGKEHREWFEVEASRDGVKKVDEVVKRWVEWAERTA